MGGMFGTVPSALPLPNCATARPEIIYNRLQDVRALTLVLDVRREALFRASHICGAHNFRLGMLGRWGGASARSVGIVVDQTFGEIRGGPWEAAFVLCVDSQSATDTAMISDCLAGIASRSWSARVTAVAVFDVDFGAYRQRFPFHCNDVANRIANDAANRVLPSISGSTSMIGESETGPLESRLLPSAIWPHCPTVEVDGLHVYLSSWALASDPYVFAALSPTHVVNCTPDHENVFEDKAAYFRVPVVDTADQNLLVHLDSVVAFIESARTSGILANHSFAPVRNESWSPTRTGVVLIHCRHGQSRSAAVVIAWLCASGVCHGGLEDALAHLRRCRPRVSPNPGFLAQLDHWLARRACSSDVSP